MNILKNIGFLLLLTGIPTKTFLVSSSAPESKRNGTGDPIQFSGWKPLVKPEALSTDEFPDVSATAANKARNGSDLEAADSKRSFLLVYPPRAAGTEEDPQKAEAPSQGSPRIQNPPPSGSDRNHRMMNFAEGQQNNKAAYHQRPVFPPVANPPPLPDHALRQRVPPNFTPESTSQHQVQIQLLDGYIVPPSGGGASNNHAEKKPPQITTFPLNLNNVPEIRLLLPGDVHAQLNHLRQGPQQQQIRNPNAYPGSPNSNGRNNSPESNVHSFESQRRPGRTVEYNNDRNNAPSANNYGRPQQGTYNQNQDPRKLNNNFSPPDPAIYPEQVNFPGQNNQNYQNNINNAVSYNHVKTYSNGNVSPNDNLPNNGRIPEQPQRDNRFPISQTKISDSVSGPGYPQNYGGQQIPVSGNRTPISQTVIRDSSSEQGFPQNYAGQQNPTFDGRTPISQTVIQDTSNGQAFPQNFRGQQNPGSNSRVPISQSKITDDINSQSFPQNYGGQQNPGSNNRVPISQSKITDDVNSQSFPQNYGSGEISVSDGRTSTKSHGTTNTNSFAPNFGGQQNPSLDGRNPSIRPNTQGTVNVQNYSPNLGNEQNPSVGNRNPIHSKTQGTVNVQNYSPDFRNQQNPTIGSGTPIHSKTQGTVNVQNYSPNLRNQQNPTVSSGTPIHSKTQGSVNVQSYSPNLGGQQNPSVDNRSPTLSKANLPGGQNSGGQRNSNQPQSNPSFYSGQVPIEAFQGTRNSFKPVSNDNRSYNPRNDQNGIAYPNSQIPNNAISGSTTYQQSKLNNNINNNRNSYSNAWQGTQLNGRNQNFNPGGSSIPGKTNFYSGDLGNQNTNSQNGQPESNFSSFGSGESPQKSHGSALSSPSSAQGNQNRAGTELDRFVSPQNNNDRRSSTEDASFSSPDKIDKKPVNSQGSTDDIYFVPPVLSQEQVQIDPFGVPTSRDTTANTNIAKPVSTGRADEGLSDQKNILDFVNVDGGVSDRQSDKTFERTGYCECSQSCAPLQRSASENLGPSIRQIARSLNADAFFDFIGLSDEEIENTLASDGSYTLFIPSNEAVSRLPSNLIDHWRENNPDLTMALMNHVVRDKITLDQLKLGGRMTSRANEATLFINNYNNEAVTVNGHRIVQGDITAPRGGIIHVLDGTLCPVADQDIINTLRTCNKYDGFLTLADVTKLLETMQDEGPFTVFLPSNEALTKIPADELAILKENSTVLRDFLEYHIVKGAYFSGDLKDSQYLTTLHGRQPVKMGIRVDGCYRRLVEVNNSPVFKADIPTKNGVIHVVDWILRPSDLQWCEGVVLP